MKKSYVIILSIVVSLLFGAIGYSAGYFIFAQGRLHNFASTGIHTRATVTAKDRDSHRSIRYEYEVGGERFEGAGSPARVGRQFEQINLQDQIPVLYDPANPSDSLLGDPEALAASHEPLILLVSLVFAGIGFLTLLPFVTLFGKTRVHN